MDETDRLIEGLDEQLPRWWQEFANEQDWRGTIGEAIDPFRKPITYEDMQEAIGRLKRNVARRLFAVIRVALEAKLVVLP